MHFPRLLQNKKKILLVLSLGCFLLVLFFTYEGSFCTQKTQFMATLDSCTKKSGLEVKKLENWVIHELGEWDMRHPVWRVYTWGP